MVILHTMNSDYTKSPRLYLPDALSENGTVILSKEHAHYLLSVLRKTNGEIIRIFNGTDGEFIGIISPTSKKAADIIDLKKIKDQPTTIKKIHLYFAPIKKDRLGFLIEKTVELGVTDLHPVMTAHTENRKPNMDKIQAYITEAAEQSERLDMPVLHEVQNIMNCKFHTPTYAAIERSEYNLLSLSNRSTGLLVGPEGGWSDEEVTYLTTLESIHPVSLGANILRAETAALFMLARSAG